MHRSSRSAQSGGPALAPTTAGRHHMATATSAEILAAWPEGSREAASAVVTQYGEPHEATDSELVWHGVGSWKRIEGGPSRGAGQTRSARRISYTSCTSQVLNSGRPAAAGQPRQILAPLRTVGVREIRVIAEIMDRVQSGQPQTISLNGRFPVVLISIDEFDRLRDLTRTVSWFRAAGLDLIEADEPEIAEFVRRFREGPAAAGESNSAVG